MRLKYIVSDIYTNKVMSLMVVLLVAMGIGSFGTTYSVYYMMANNPLASSESLTRYVRVDDWEPQKDLNWIPPLLAYNDAIHLASLALPETKKALTYDSGAIIIRSIEDQPYETSARVTTPDFFSLFNVDFKYGRAWSAKQGEQKKRVVVLTSEINEKMFGGENSVGQTLIIEGEIFTVQGVLLPFSMTPKIYDLHVYPFGKLENILIPFQTGIDIGASPYGRMMGWRDEEVSNFDETLESSMIWLQLWLKFNSNSEMLAYQDAVYQYISEQKSIGRMLRNTVFDVLISPKDWLQLNKVIKTENRFLVLLAFAFFLICMISCMGLLYASFNTRKKKLAIQRAIGASRTRLIYNMLFEVLFLALIGCVIGGGIVYLGLQGMQELYGGSMHQLAEMSVASLSVSISLTVFSTALISLFPIINVCYQAPAPLLK